MNAVPTKRNKSKLIDLLKTLQNDDLFSLARHVIEFQEDSKVLNSGRNYFHRISELARDYVEDQIDKRIRERNSNDYVEIHDNAIKGDSLAVKMMKDMIDEFISGHGYTRVDYPKPYQNLTEAIFHETYGWGPLIAWVDMEVDSEAVKVIGTDIFIKFKHGWELQEYGFRNTQDVLSLTERFKLLEANNHLDSHTNSIMETVSRDGKRISVMIPHRSFEPLITLRNQTITKHSFEKQAELGTIPYEAVVIFKILSRLKAKGIIAGPPAVGKSTFMLTMMAETTHLQTAYIEPEYEHFPRLLFPKSPIQHVVGKGKILEEKIFPAILRQDIEQIIMAEVRRDEVEFYGTSGERGIKKILGTFHSADPENIPGILARLNMQHHQGGGLSYGDEYIRFADNLHFSVTMDELEDGRKRVTGIHFYDVDKFTWEVKVMKIMDYDWETDSWSYAAELPKRIEKILLRHSRKDYIAFVETLKELSKSSPMFEETRVLIGKAGLGGGR